MAERFAWHGRLLAAAFSLVAGLCILAATPWAYCADEPIPAEAPLPDEAGDPPRAKPAARAEANKAKADERSNSLSVALIAAGVVFAYYVAAWLLVGRDAAGAASETRFEPPSGVSPALARYLARMGFDRRCLTASLLNLAVKGAIVIERSPDGAKLIRSENSPHDLSPEDRRVLAGLFDRPNRQSVDWSGKRAARDAEARPLRTMLLVDQQKRLWGDNRKALLGGLALSFVALVAAALAAPLERLFVSLFMIAWLSIWSIGVLVLLIAAIASWVAAIKTRSGPAFLVALFFTAFASPFVAGEFFGLSVLYGQGSPELALLLLVLATMALVFWHALKARTAEGSLLFAELAGFRRYLEGQEDDAFSLVRKPLPTPAIFSRWLPYAVALSVETKWAQQFDETIWNSTEESLAWFRADTAPQSADAMARDVVAALEDRSGDNSVNITITPARRRA